VRPEELADTKTNGLAEGIDSGVEEFILDVAYGRF
jgi:hypothetical protein